MDTVIKLIYKSNMSYLPTQMPVQFFGLPDGKVYIIYARFYEIKFDRTHLEFVIAEHKEFAYDFERGKLIPKYLSGKEIPVYEEMVDKPNPKIEIVNIYRDISTFKEAEELLKLKARQIIYGMNTQSQRNHQDSATVKIRKVM